MKQFMIDGRLGSDAEVKTNKNVKPYFSVAIANDESISNGDGTYTTQTTWYNITSYDEYYIKGVKRFMKGRYVIVTGDLSWTPRMGDDNKLYVNLFITPNNIYTPNVGQRPTNENAQNGMQVAAQRTTDPRVPQQTYAPQQAPQVQAPRMSVPQVQTPQVQTPQMQMPQVYAPQQAPQAYVPQQTPQVQTPQAYMPQATVQAPQPYTPQVMPTGTGNGDDLPF